MVQRVERASTPVTFLAGQLAVNEVVPFQMVARYMTDGAPRPVVAHVDIYNILSESSSEYLATPSRTVELAAGFLPQTHAIGDTGRLRFTYGTQAAKRVILTDLKSGSYQLPPSDEVTIEANVSGPPESVFSSSLTVRAACAEGWHNAPARPVFSYSGTVETDWSALPYPDGARWVTVLHPGIPGTSTAVLRLQPNDAGAIVYLDFANASYYPSVLPTELGPRFNNSSWELLNESETPVSAMVRFFLEF